MSGKRKKAAEAVAHVITGKAKKPHTSHNNIFENIQLCFIPGFGSDFLSSRADILHKQTLQRGGAVIVLKKKGNKFVKSDISRCSHVIVSQDMPEKVLQELSVNPQVSCIITPEWITACIKSQSLLPTQPYNWRPCLVEQNKVVSAQTEIDHPPDSPNAENQQSCSELQVKRKKGFAFQNKSDNKNSHITKILSKLRDIYAALGDNWREYAYKKACDALKRIDAQIKTEEDVDVLGGAEIRGLGQKMIDKIKEIVTTGSLEKLRSLENDTKVKTLIMFSNVWGAGASTAMKWYNAGYRTLEDVQKSGALNFQQEVGVKYFDALLLRIPRDEVEELEHVVKNAAQFIVKDNEPDRLRVITCGSYRRLAPDCGDIDILISHDSESVLDGFLHELIQKLTQDGFLTDHLSMPSRIRQTHEDQEETWSETYMGICQLSPSHLHRRIDIKVYPMRLMAFALLHFTGSEHFGRSLRLYAKRKGYSLSDCGLRKAVRSGKEAIWRGSSAVCATEEDIFKALGLEYIEPHERNALDGAKNFDAIATGPVTIPSPQLAEDEN